MATMVFVLPDPGGLIQTCQRYAFTTMSDLFHHSPLDQSEGIVINCRLYGFGLCFVDIVICH